MPKSTLRVVATFQHLPSGRYVEPGQSCPELDAETEARLLAAGCVIREQAERATPAPADEASAATPDPGAAQEPSNETGASPAAPPTRPRRGRGR